LKKYLRNIYLNTFFHSELERDSPRRNLTAAINRDLAKKTSRITELANCKSGAHIRRRRASFKASRILSTEHELSRTASSLYRSLPSLIKQTASRKNRRNLLAESGDVEILVASRIYSDHDYSHNCAYWKHSKHSGESRYWNRTIYGYYISKTLRFSMKAEKTEQFNALWL